jgi:hypothetical protein
MLERKHYITILSYHNLAPVLKFIRNEIKYDIGEEEGREMLDYK